MTAPADDDVLVSGYLDRLARATADLPPDRREELLASIAEHLDAARDPADPLAVRRALDRLGPAEVVAASAGAPSAPGAPPSRPWWELAAVLLLTLGSLAAPLVGWLAGVVLLWMSRLWTTGEKVLGTLVLPGGLATALIGGAVAVGVPSSSTTCSSGGTFDSGTGQFVQGPLECVSSGPPGWLRALLLLALLAVVVSPVVVAVVLYRRAAARAAAGGAGPRRAR